MVRTDTNILINRPVEEVWNYLIDHRKVPNWAVGVKESRFITEPPMRLGAKCHWDQTFLGMDISSDEEVVEYEPYKVITFKAVSGPFPMTYRYTFEPTTTGTKLAVVAEAEPGGFFKLATPILASMVKRALYHSFENLKELVEAEALVHV